MLPRVLEPEVMDTAEEATDYDAMDHVDVNARFCDDLVLARPTLRTAKERVLDLGTGTARIPIALCARAPAAEVVAVDLAEQMLVVARKNVAAAGLAGRVTVTMGDAKGVPFGDASFDVVMSNSILHHIPEPRHALAEMWRALRRGGTLFVRDLARPSTADDLARLVALHGGTPSSAAPADVAAHARQRGLFEASLHAALTPDELAQAVAPLGIAPSAIRTTSDRHWTLSCTKP